MTQPGTPLPSSAPMPAGGPARNGARRPWVRWLLIVVGLAAILWIAYSMGRRGAVAERIAATRPAGERAPSGFWPATRPFVVEFGDTVDRLYNPEATSAQRLLRGTINVMAATAIGFFGAWAFYIGVITGFIERTARDDVLLHLVDDPRAIPPARRSLLRFFFYFFGGVVAGVFQWAQADTLAPIQAFVLGIT